MSQLQSCNCTYDYRSYEPADWSILSCSLVELLSSSVLLGNASHTMPLPSISDLKFASKDLIKLRQLSLFPDDTVDVFCNFSLEYLINSGLSAEAISLIMGVVYNDLDAASNIDSQTFTINVSDIPVFSDINIDMISKFIVPGIFWDKELSRLFENAENKTWINLKSITEREILEQYGTGYRGFLAVIAVWKLKKVACDLLDMFSESISVEAYSSFDQLIISFVQSLVKKPNDYLVVMGRLGYLDRRIWTLEELGCKLNLTRERIRQIEKKIFTVINKPKTLDRLSLLWYAVDEVLAEGGGACCIRELSSCLKSKWDWPELPTEQDVITLLELSSKYKLVVGQQNLVIIPDHDCVKCAHVVDLLAREVVNSPTGTLKFDNAKYLIRSFCENRPCQSTKYVSRISDGLLFYFESLLTDISSDDFAFYSKNAWIKKYGKRRLDLVETVLRDAGRAMHFTEVCAEINNGRPEEEKYLDRNIHAYLSRSKEVWLWDRGTYILKDNINVPEDLLDRIESEIIRRLNSSIPYLSVSGIYKQFVGDLEVSNIPSESALYTCLRELRSNNIKFPEYPYIMKRDKIERLPVPLVVEKYIANNKGIVSYDEIHRYAVESLCIDEALFESNHFPNVQNILRYEKTSYIHKNNIEISINNINPIIDHLKYLLKASGHVSVVKVFKDKIISCKLNNIGSPIFLYSLIQCYFKDEFQLPYYPKICLAEFEGLSCKSPGVSREIINYIKNKNAPCGYAELNRYFVAELGYSGNSIYNICTTNVILKYSEGVLVHIDSLEWSQESQIYLEELASQYINNRLASGKVFGLVSDFYEYYHIKLPDLPSDIHWTSTLIGELLVRGDKFHVVGPAKNAFVSCSNQNNINTFDDLLANILNVKFDGAANIDEIKDYLCKAGIINKSLTSIMLINNGPVIIEGDVVMLSRFR